MPQQASKSTALKSKSTALKSKSTALKMPTEWKSIAFIASIPDVVPSACKVLKEDGSNYDDWEVRIVSLIETITGLVGYFDQEDGIKIDPHGDRIIRNMIEHSISTRLARQISRCNSAKSALIAIKDLVIIPRPSTHLALWRDLLQHKLNANSDINNYLRNIDTKISALDRSGFPWTKDSIKGMIYQLGLGSQFPDISPTLDSRLRYQPSKPISSPEVASAIRAGQLNLKPVNVSDTLNFSRLHLTPRLDVKPSLPSNSLPSNHKSRSVPLTGDRLAQWTRSQPHPPLDLVDIDGNSFTAEAAILGEVDGPERSITESWNQFEAANPQARGS